LYNDTKGFPQDMVDRIRNILTVLISANDMNDVNGPPGWNIHPLSGNRSGTWSISVTGNWRITFSILNNEIYNLNLEDYHK
jgi:proteic killer suppression protein